MKKQNLKNLRLGKINIADLDIEKISGGIDTTKSTYGPCQNGTSLCDNTDTWEPAPIGSGPLCTA